MLGLAKRVNARMLLASTSEVYGDPEVHPQDENYWGNGQFIKYEFEKPLSFYKAFLKNDPC